MSGQDSVPSKNVPSYRSHIRDQFPSIPVPFTSNYVTGKRYVDKVISRAEFDVETRNIRIRAHIVLHSGMSRGEIADHMEEAQNILATRETNWPHYLNAVNEQKWARANQLSYGFKTDEALEGFEFDPNDYAVDSAPPAMVDPRCKFYGEQESLAEFLVPEDMSFHRMDDDVALPMSLIEKGYFKVDMVDPEFSDDDSDLVVADDGTMFFPRPLQPIANFKEDCSEIMSLIPTLPEQGIKNLILSFLPNQHKLSRVFRAAQNNFSVSIKRKYFECGLEACLHTAGTRANCNLCFHFPRLSANHPLYRSALDSVDLRFGPPRFVYVTIMKQICPVKFYFNNRVCFIDLIETAARFQYWRSLCECESCLLPWTLLLREYFTTLRFQNNYVCGLIEIITGVRLGERVLEFPFPCRKFIEFVMSGSPQKNHDPATRFYRRDFPIEFALNGSTYQFQGHWTERSNLGVRLLSPACSGALGMSDQCTVETQLPMMAPIMFRRTGCRCCYNRPSHGVVPLGYRLPRYGVGGEFKFVGDWLPRRTSMAQEINQALGLQ